MPMCLNGKCISSSIKHAFVIPTKSYRCRTIAVFVVVPGKLLYETGAAATAKAVSTVGMPGIVLKRLQNTSAHDQAVAL